MVAPVVVAVRLVARQAVRLVARRVDRVVVRQAAHPAVRAAELAVPTALLRARDVTTMIAVRGGVMTMVIDARVAVLMDRRRARDVTTTIAVRGGVTMMVIDARVVTAMVAPTADVTVDVIADVIVDVTIVQADALVDVPTIDVAVVRMVEAVADPRRDQVIAVSHPVVSKAKSESHATKPNVAAVRFGPVARARPARISNPLGSNANPSSGSTKARPCVKRRCRPPSAPPAPRRVVSQPASSTRRSRRPSKRPSNLVAPLD